MRRHVVLSGRLFEHLIEVRRHHGVELRGAVRKDHRRDDVTRRRRKVLRVVIQAVAGALRPDANEQRQVEALQFELEALDAPERKLQTVARRNVEHPFDARVDGRVGAQFGFDGAGRFLGARLFLRLLFFGFFAFELFVNRRLFGRLFGRRSNDVVVIRSARFGRFEGGIRAAETGLDARGFRQHVLRRNAHLLRLVESAAFLALRAPIKEEHEGNAHEDENDHSLIRHDARKRRIDVRWKTIRDTDAVARRAARVRRKPRGLRCCIVTRAFADERGRGTGAPVICD